VHFTVGQRRGINVGFPEPLYVVKLDAVRKRVVVGPREALLTQRMTLSDVNWLGEIADGQPVFVRVRSTRAPQPARIFAHGGKVEVEIDNGEEGVAPGQACVVYESADSRARVLGGGIIRATVPMPLSMPARAPLEAAE
jgi:tRNA-specific 2-thiouridylase